MEIASCRFGLWCGLESEALRLRDAERRDGLQALGGKQLSVRLPGTGVAGDGKRGFDRGFCGKLLRK